MFNNIGVINTTLSKTLGATTNVNENVYMNIISGQMGIGLIVFDDDGTMAVCTNITGEIGSGNAIYEFTTRVINAQIDVDYILTQGY